MIEFLDGDLQFVYILRDARRQHSTSPHGGSTAPCWLILISEGKQKKKIFAKVGSNALAGQINLRYNVGEILETLI